MSSSGRTRSNANPAVESAVTRLLVSIKALLESLTSWSQLRIDENEVSNVYVRLGNDFNAAVAAFSAFGIDMSELLTVPDDLRNVLEQCLAEEATPDNLAIYLPTVRQIITNLLQGLRGKQSIYRRIVSDNKHRSTDSRRSSKRSTTSKAGTDEARDSVSRRPGSSKRREPSITNGDGVPTIAPQYTGGSSTIPEDTDSEVPPPPPPPPSTIPDSPPKQSVVPPPIQPPPLPSYPIVTTTEPSPPPPQTGASDQTFIPVPATVKRFSLEDRPMPQSPSLVVQPSTPDNPDMETRINGGSSSPAPDTPPINGAALPVVAKSSLAALQKSDTLERRASKRFSTYNISKITGTGARSGSRSGQSSNRRSLAVSNALTPGDLAALTEVDDEDKPIEVAEPVVSPRREGSGAKYGTRKQFSRPSSPSKHPVPPLPASPEPPNRGQTQSPAQASTQQTGRITLFLQLGREVKKTSLVVDGGISMAALRVLFVDKFSYTPGMENFPAIYIRDNMGSGVQYELEDVDEVKDGCLLSLNIEPLDQIKQHIDTQIATLSQDLKELKVAMANRPAEQFMMPPTIIGAPLAESTPIARPSDRQFQTVARNLSRFNGPPHSPIVSQMTGHSIQAQMTGGSVLSDYSSRVMGDLKTQFDEVQNLRRDLGVMRQLYTTFMSQTKESLQTLRKQTANVKQLANTNVGGARAFINNGKAKLDSRSQNALTEIEKLQDTVEGMRDDVLKRQRTPKPHLIKALKKDIDNLSTELQSLSEHIVTIKPMWKKTWEDELQMIVEEQQFLKHQEEFLSDLIEDHKAVREVFGHVEQVIGIKGTGSGKFKRPGFKPSEEGADHNTVMMEIRNAAIDPEKRLKAIEASQRNREKELASRNNGELHEELQDFVGQKKLKMTGGAEEAERVRQKRSEATLKAMFTGQSAMDM